MTGAAGFIGSALCTQLVTQGFDTVGAVRSLPDTPIAGVDYRIATGLDINTDWCDALTGVQTVVHCAARVHVMRDPAPDPLAEFRRVNALGTEILARAAASSGVQRLVFLSSIKVNGENALPDAPFDEASPVNPQDVYAISKWEAEQALTRIAAETGLEVVVLRCPLVYGPGVKGNFLRLLQAIDHSMPLPFALARNNRRSLIYLGNLVSAIITCLKHPAAAGETYLTSDGKDVSTAQLITQMAQALDKSVYLWPMPQALMQLIAGFTGKSAEVDRLFGSLCIDSTKIHEELDWMPAFTLEQGLAETVQWFQGRDRRS